MGLFKSGSGMSLNDWCSEAVQMTTKKVEKIEMCSVPASGTDHDNKGTHDVESHTFLCAYMEPTAYRKQEVVVFERIKSFPYRTTVPGKLKGQYGSYRWSPTLSDFASIIPQNPPIDIVHKLEVERSLELDNHLTLQELATILKLIGDVTKSAWPGVSCENEARLFAFACWVALVPPRKSPTGKFVHEDEARYFLDQLSWRTRDMDAQSLEAVELIQQKRAENSDR